MNKEIYPNHEFIKTQEDYDRVKLYLEEYIIRLLGEPQIRRKRSLIEIFNDLSKKGYIGSGWKQQFFKDLFNFEPKHKGGKIDLYLEELYQFKTRTRTSQLPLFKTPKKNGTLNLL